MLLTTRSDSPPSRPARTRPPYLMDNLDNLDNSGLNDLHETVSEVVVIIQRRHCYYLRAQMNAIKHTDVQSDSEDPEEPDLYKPDRKFTFSML